MPSSVSQGTRWLNDSYVFDFKSNAWSEIEARGDLPSVRSCPAWAKDDRYVYVLGGYDGVERKSDFFACDLTTYTWTQMPCLGTPPSPRYFRKSLPNNPRSDLSTATLVLSRTPYPSRRFLLFVREQVIFIRWILRDGTPRGYVCLRF